VTTTAAETLTILKIWMALLSVFTANKLTKETASIAATQLVVKC
jgi:hypothetical protein